ncbi:hypothetical protein [Bdellovibrio sp. NC01]|uniref:hypothetical protein n=1 Tax=Bdellovibrio sp. NC01 TaxID=2220073 RepID=UPI001158D3E7|nr:hypothetical protein [Bdellovibrio sp. NC01]QDK39089.1 hypothetical protein DOE51_16585 [Bdellovibrio sp. NC01]
MKFLGALLFLLPLHTFAKGIACHPNLHESQVQISWNENEVIMHVENPTGYSYMPQMETVGESSIPFLKMQSEDLRKLGDTFEYKWSRKDCELGQTDEWLISCHAESKSDNGITAYGFTTAKMTETSLNGKFETFRVRLILLQTNTYFVTIPTALEKCARF